MSGTTRLQEALLDPGAKRSKGPLRAFRLARRKWWAGERLDLTALADELGVTRVTLYRWVGTREQLLVEIIWHFSKLTFDYYEKRVTSTGADRLVEVITGFVETVTTNPGMNAWLSNEGESAMRLLTRYETDFQPRLVGWIENAITREIDRGALSLPVPPEEVAYAVEQLVESYVYLELITGEPSGARKPGPILRLIFQNPET